MPGTANPIEAKDLEIAGQVVKVIEDYTNEPDVECIRVPYSDDMAKPTVEKVAKKIRLTKENVLGVLAMPVIGAVFAVAEIESAIHKKKHEKKDLTKLEQLGKLNGVEVEVNS